MKVKLDTSPLKSEHAHRGIGQYTAQLVKAFETIPDLELLSSRSSDKPDLVHYPFFDFFFDTLPLRSAAPAMGDEGIGVLVLGIGGMVLVGAGLEGVALPIGEERIA